MRPGPINMYDRQTYESWASFKSALLLSELKEFKPVHYRDLGTACVRIQFRRIRLVSSKLESSGKLAFEGLARTSSGTLFFCKISVAGSHHDVLVDFGMLQQTDGLPPLPFGD